MRAQVERKMATREKEKQETKLRALAAKVTDRQNLASKKYLKKQDGNV